MLYHQVKLTAVEHCIIVSEAFSSLVTYVPSPGEIIAISLMYVCLDVREKNHSIILPCLDFYLFVILSALYM